jgi:hypothetical protein
LTRHRVPLAIGLLLVCIAVAHGYNMLHWPYIEDDEGDYLSRAWAIFHLGKLTPNTYFYDHVPLGWIQIAIWEVFAGGVRLSSLAAGRTLMLLFQLGSALLMIYIGRRASGKLWVGLLAAALASLLPFGLQYQRRILLDNICTFWLLASLAVLCGRVTLTRVWISAVAFGIAVLSKEIALAALPALAVMVSRRYGREHRLFAVSGWLGLALSLCSIYVLAALIKGELFPAGTALGGTRPHVSLICSIEWQASRGADGGILDSSSGFWHAVHSWVHSEPLLVVGGTAAMAYLIIMRRRNVIASTIAWLTLSLWLFLGRGGLVSDFYLVPMLPLLALGVAITVAAMADGIRTWARSPNGAAALVIVICLVGVAIGAGDAYSRVGVRAWTADPVKGQLEAISWVQRNLPRNSRILIDDYMWPGLHTPATGTPFPDAVYYWDAGYDPNLRRAAFDDNWRRVQYVVTTPQVYHDVTDLGFPLVAEALEHSVLVRTFNTGNWPVQIRRVEPGAPTLLLAAPKPGTTKEPACMTYAGPSAARFSPKLPAVGIAASSPGTPKAAAVVGQLDDDHALGATWVRSDFAWSAIEPRRGVFEWGEFDQFVAAARSRAFNVIATIGYTPAWANGGHNNDRFAPTSPAQFATFAGQVAARYGPGGVHVYEIWNEPNIQYWQPTPDPAAYARVLCAAYTAIHRADPQAIVLSGGTSPAANTPKTYAPQTWLADLYADGAGRCFDAVAYHPYVDSVATHDNLGGNWYLMGDSLRSIMVSHGDGAKRIWATEVGCNRAELGDRECSDRLTKAMALWRSYGWSGVLCWFTYLGSSDYTLFGQNGKPLAEWYAYRRAAAQY